MICWYTVTIPTEDEQTQHHSHFENDRRYSVHLPNDRSRTSQGSMPAVDLLTSPSNAGEADGPTNGLPPEPPIEPGFSPSSIRGMDARLGISANSDWPKEFSLEAKQGYSNQLIGLSCESDPFLLRHYLYNMHDTYLMFRLDFRKMVDDTNMRSSGATMSIDHSQLPANSIPVHFVMSDENVWKDDVEAVQEGLLSGSSSEKDDVELLAKLVPDELGSKLLKL
jgi:hypothetical protein